MEFPDSLPVCVGNYTLVEEIGRGSYGVVYRAQHNSSKLDVAIKVISKSRIEQQGAQMRFAREIHLMQRMEHPLICNLFQILEDSAFHYIVMEFVPNGDLRSLIADTKKLDEMTARRYFIQIICVLEHLHHDLRIVHRDLKAENLLLDRNNNIRLIDFGLSNAFSDQSPCLKTACGSCPYIPPEMIKEQAYTASVDVWSVGVLLYLLVVGHFPFEGEDVASTMQRIVYANPFFPSSVSPPLVDLLKKMLCKDPQRRITLDQIRCHPWFAGTEFTILMAWMQGQVPHMRSVRDSVIDPGIVEQMSAMGVSTACLRQQLFLHNNVDDAAALYRLLLREKSIDQLAETVMRARKAKTGSLDRLCAPSFVGECQKPECDLGRPKPGSAPKDFMFQQRVERPAIARPPVGSCASQRRKRGSLGV